MKLKIILFFLILATCFSFGQGFIVDQQSTNLVEGSALLNNLGQPMGQSFTPTRSSVEFIRLYLYNDLSGTVYVNLRSNSITGLILGTSAGVFMPDFSFIMTNFIFSAPIAITAGITYYIQPLIQSGGGGFASYITDASYTGGSEFLQGNPVVGRNLWFQEGVIGTPEPSSFALTALAGLLLWRSARKS